MALTEKQKNNIYHLPKQDLIEILDICTESLGIVSQKEYMYITGYRKCRTQLNNDMSTGKILFIEIGKIKFPIINDR